MFKDRLKGVFGGKTPGSETKSEGRAGANGAPAQSYCRQSSGLEQFFSSLRDSPGMTVLDFAGASQANVSFITELGCKIYTEDFLAVLDEHFGAGDFYANQAEPARAQAFLSATLNLPERCLSGALLWDGLQYLSPSLLGLVVGRLYRMMRPNAYLLAFFNANEKASSIPVHSYRIQDGRTLVLAARGQRRPAQFFNNRALEKLFEEFASVKFFLTRDHLREVLVKR